MAPATPRWTQVLPFVLLGLRSVIKEDVNATAANCSKLNQSKKEDLRRIASELELCVSEKLTVLDFMDLIKTVIDTKTILIQCMS
ncbi:hypothetical protein TNCV_991831 [Trichonephila clavipes]|nr:hypothetical protein TNCV_991831 [Trichonephila clavipes]